jgi:hypothetical protein
MKEWRSDETVLQIAVMDVNSEETRGVALREQQSFAQALEKAQKAKEIVLRELARKGGKAPKRDALNELIREIALEDPNITAKELLEVLARPRGAGVVTSIDEPSPLLPGDVPCIHYVNDDEKPRRGSIAGLKDRLSRAKRKINS